MVTKTVTKPALPGAASVLVAAGKVTPGKASATKARAEKAPKAASQPAATPVAKSVAKPAAKPTAHLAAQAAAIPAAPAPVQAMAVAEKPPTVAPESPLKDEAAKADKTAKAKKSKLVRDSFTMPEAEYDLIAAVKKRCIAQGHAAKKSEVLRAAIIAFAAQNDAAVLAALLALDAIKTGRPPQEVK